MAKARRGKKRGTGRVAGSGRRTRAVTRTARDAQIAFEAISIEGGLLSPGWLARAAQLQAGRQSEADYRIPKGLNLRDEIGRYWRIAQALWQEFSAGRSAGSISEQRAQAVADRFVQALLRESFGFNSLGAVDAVEVDSRSYPIGFSALEGRVPVVIAPAASGVDALSPTFGDGSRRRSAFGVCQEFLNAEDDALWGLVSDGVTFRILRDNASLTRPAWIEADLGRIFTEERYADFAALWLLVHETRFGRSEQPVTECSLETWREAGREEGTRAREHLRHGVEEALVTVGQGFLAHPENQSLRAALADGSLTKEAYFQELLRLVYRLIFLLTAEERGVLHPVDASESARRLYAEGYSLRRLRERSIRRSAHDRFHDHWETVKIVFRGLASCEPRLALPGLLGIFAADQCPSLDAARLENRSLLLALFRLSWLREQSGLARVNWRDMGPEELGSVYESLLELVPQVTEGGREFIFAAGAEAKGNARKKTGSYYTPDSLVQVLLDSALEPVVESAIAAHPNDPAEALLSLSIVDPACGSGHFLLAAARRLAAHVARLQAKGTPSAAEYRHALREVVGRCLYGVDLNPMAVELCKVSLWMEAVEPGLPLTFLDSHIQQGDALLGTTPELMEQGVPDEAWKPIEGDDKKTASALKKRNSQAATGQRGLDTLWSARTGDQTDTVREAVVALESAPDADPEALVRKESQWHEILESEAYRHQKLVADAWCAAFVWPKQPGPLVDAAPTNDLWRQIRDRQGHPPKLTVKTTNKVSELYSFFHWHLAFPQVFHQGGFDLVIGNPPWDKIQVEDRHFFASTHPEIAEASAKRRKALIKELETSDLPTFLAYKSASRRTLCIAHFAKRSNRFPLTGRGNIITHSVFLELAYGLLAQTERSRLALLVPSGLASQDSQKKLFAFLVDGRLRVLFDFENSKGLFAAVDSRFRFAVVVGSATQLPEPAKFSFFLRSTDELGELGRTLVISPDYLQAVSPNTQSCPLARTQRDLDLLLQICSAGSALQATNAESPWGWQSTQMINETHESDRLVAPQLDDEPRSVDRLYEAKLLHQFDHRYATFADRTSARPFSETEHRDPSALTRTRWMVPTELWDDRISSRNHGREWIIAFRKITNATNERTFISTILPRAGAGSQTPVVTVSGSPGQAALLLGNLNAFVFDFGARLRTSGTDLNHFIVNQLFVIPPARYEDPQWAHLAVTIRNAVLELTYTAWDLEPFASDVGYEGPPFRWDEERRFWLRAELDATFFHLYGIARDDVEYIMETFPIVRKNDEKAHGEYYTKRVILEIYDAMADAARLGEHYQTRLDPPPADPRLAHPPRSQRSGAELEGS